MACSLIRRTIALFVLVITLLAVVACSDGPTPIADAARSATRLAAENSRTPTPTLPPTATRTPKPTATFVPLVTPSPTPYVLRISVEEAKVKVDAGEALLVDVRAGSTYEAQHIVGAISLPANEVPARYAELPRDKLVVFYCA